MTGLWSFYRYRWIFRNFSPLRRVVDDALTNAIKCCVVPYNVFFRGAGFKPAPTGVTDRPNQATHDRLSLVLNDFAAGFVIL